MNRSSRQEISKKTLDLYYALDETSTDVYRTFYLTAAECTFFSDVHGAFFRIYHIPILSGIFSDHNGVKLEINNGKNWKIDKYVEIKQHAPEKPVGQRRNKKPENVMRHTKIMGYCKNNSKGEVYNDKCLH